jgi:hypothetical protein
MTLNFTLRSQEYEILLLEEARILPYFKDLARIRRVLEAEKKSFPEGFCYETSILVNEFTGLGIVGGHYQGFVESAGLSVPHAWNHDAERGLYIDLTQSQFACWIPRIAVMPDNTQILLPLRHITQEVEDAREYLNLNKFAEKIREPAELALA